MTSYGGSLLVVAAGFIGKLKIEILLTRIQSRAWVVHIDQVYLVAVPSQLMEVRTSYSSFLLPLSLSSHLIPFTSPLPVQ